MTVFAVFFLASYFTGLWADIIMLRLRSECTVLYRISFGGCVLIALGMIVCFAGSLFGASSTVCICIYAVIAAALTVAAVPAACKRKISLFPFVMPRFHVYDSLYLAVILLISVQIAGVFGYSFDNAGVLRGIPEAVKVFDSGVLAPADPMMLFTGSLSRIMNVHPLRFVHGCLAVPLILFYYLCTFEVIRVILPSDERRPVALLTVTLLAMWGYQSDFLLGAALLLKWYGIWVFVLFGLANVSAVILIRYLEMIPETVPVRDIEETEDEDPDQEEWDMKKHRIVNARNLAIALGVLAACLAASVFILNGKINRLYAATVNLQTDINSRCSIYEFIPESGQTEGYLITGSDGTVTFIGGGSSKNSGLLETFLDEHVNNINIWYIYGEDEESSGAMRALIHSGRVDPEKIYVIDREDVTGIR